jgi:hypothetical protein
MKVINSPKLNKYEVYLHFPVATSAVIPSLHWHVPHVQVRPELVVHVPPLASVVAPVDVIVQLPYSLFSEGAA